MANLAEAWGKIDKLTHELGLIPLTLNAIPSSKGETGVIVSDQSYLLGEPRVQLLREVVFIPDDSPPYPAFAINAVLLSGDDIHISLALATNLGPTGLAMIDIPKAQEEIEPELVADTPNPPAIPVWWRSDYPDRVVDISSVRRDTIQRGEIVKLLYEAELPFVVSGLLDSFSPQEALTNYLATLTTYLTNNNGSFCPVVNVD